ncbi:MAG: 4Fe-4S dicluster domain-containing protein [candidate division WOR-3 bacterium]|nr:4Fe-4S dicluster domain-containing protein [candidate division WOR-3 bacterium]MDW7987386.1 4Fe-4S dicluster domain-containing protein [candidate division WOR-3 bacterium]
MALYFLSRYHLTGWLRKLKEKYQVILPQYYEAKLYYEKLNGENVLSEENFYHALRKIRPANPLKEFFFTPKLKVGGLVENKAVLVPFDDTPRIIIGVKNCDLHGLRVHEKMYLAAEYQDPFHKHERSRTIIISADCPEPEETCFCNLLDLKPYPEIISDIIITPITGGYLFESISRVGEDLIINTDHNFRAATQENIAERAAIRSYALEKLQKINQKSLSVELSEHIKHKTEHEFWQTHALSCVECFGCLLICPTCFCFLLYDVPINDKGFERYKIWDACYYNAYARVGGGANPRAEFGQRFRNRFHCKFMNFYWEHKFYACSGCGRCFAVCMGKIDIRKILVEV